MIIYNLSVKRYIGSAILWSLILGVLFAFVMLLFPTVSNSSLAHNLAASTSGLPLLAQEILGLRIAPNFTAPVSYFAYFFQFVVLVASLYASIIGARALSPEEGRGTIEFLYAQPVSRSSIVTQKLLSALVGYLIFTVILVVVTAGLTFFVDRSQGLAHTILVLIPAFFAMFFCGLIFLAIGFFFSSLLRSGGESIPIALAIVVVSFILGLMGSIVGQVSFLRYVSPIHFSQPITYIESGLNLIFIACGLVVIALTLFFSYFIYKRKNFLF